MKTRDGILALAPVLPRLYAPQNPQSRCLPSALGPLSAASPGGPEARAAVFPMALGPGNLSSAQTKGPVGGIC